MLGVGVRNDDARHARGLVRRALGLGSRYPDLASLDANLVHGDRFLGRRLDGLTGLEVEHAPVAGALHCIALDPAVREQAPGVRTDATRNRAPDSPSHAILEIGRSRAAARSGPWCTSHSHSPRKAPECTHRWLVRAPFMSVIGSRHKFRVFATDPAGQTRTGRRPRTSQSRGVRTGEPASRGVWCFSRLALRLAHRLKAQ